jgi:hypothetical protein
VSYVGPSALQSFSFQNLSRSVNGALSALFPEA